jgi:hypothetical protein
MSRRGGKPRRLVVDSETYLWYERHRHPAGGGCVEVLIFRRWGTHGRLEIIFQGREGRWVYGYPGTSGAVGAVGGASLNLNEPGTARAFLDEALLCGWQSERPALERIDGWLLFDAVAVRRGTRNPLEVGNE